MRIALLSDIHGNLIALNAVLADIEAQGDIDAYWVLGDLAAIGPQPVEVLERLAQLPEALFVRGNTDRYTVTSDRPSPTPEQVKADMSLLPTFMSVLNSFAWTQGAVTSTGWLPWLAGLPLEQRLTLPDGTKVLGVHASPGCDEGQGVRPGLSNAQLDALVVNCNADLVFVGHTHWPVDMEVHGVRFVNLGCVSNPLSPDLRASYVILDADDSGHTIERHRVDYDHQAVISEVNRIKHPSGDYIISFQRGEKKPSWRQKDDPPWR